MRVMIVDDHPLFREGLKAIVREAEGFSVVAEAGSGTEAMDRALEHRPDIVLMDIALPSKSGIQTIAELRSKLPNTKYVVISMHSEADYIVEAFRAGANGYMIKKSAGTQLLEGLKSVASGGMFLDSALSAEVMQRLVNLSDEDEGENDPVSLLTSRERQVMQHVVEGKTTREIAEELFISPKTVENHRANMMRKLGFSSTVELLRFAARTGVIDLDTWSS
ncbi:response regulator [Pseudodesulfovibrio senegalensis]|jgi:DNA-binding NarL/FixJ family response regulator|uniref:Response regulator transcription factor n=1 Tax=Pseudodesulfovibrio senegalensis TaxID=1721087 RepID=A0A6N6N0W5_9BACT|nr:response regulator transcription factor [Pseudodesulfovibrio senegalensis]KAB1440906.1 response regulator transcription factor [Pseudodesulfovibrio senegalensis]